MTWYPLQAAIKMSTLAGNLRGTLDALLDHINAGKDPSTGVTDPTQPQTLTVFESLTQLAAETGFSTVSVADHLKRLRGEKPLRRGLRLAVLELVEEATHHRAARYRLRPEALDRLVDRERLKAFEQSAHKPNHPYQVWKDWRTANTPPHHRDPVEASEGISSLYPEEGTAEGQGISSLDADDGQGISFLDPRVQDFSTELTPKVDPSLEELTSFLPEPAAAPTTPEKKSTLLMSRKGRRSPGRRRPSRRSPRPTSRSPPSSKPGGTSTPPISTCGAPFASSCSTREPTPSRTPTGRQLSAFSSCTGRTCRRSRPESGRRPWRSGERRTRCGSRRSWPRRSPRRRPSGRRTRRPASGRTPGRSTACTTRAARTTSGTVPVLPRRHGCWRPPIDRRPREACHALRSLV
jgi:hypothetical protein